MAANMHKPNEEEYNSSLTPLLQRDSSVSQLYGVVNTVTSENSRPTAVKDKQNPRDLLVHDDFRPSLDALSIISTHVEEDVGRRSKPSCAAESAVRPGSPLTIPTSNLKPLRREFWMRNRGSVLVVIAMFFGALMSLTARLLETNDGDGGGMHPFQVSYGTCFSG